MKYYTYLPDKCIEVLKQLKIDLTLLNTCDGLVKQVFMIKYFSAAINNANRMRDILLRYIGYFGSETRLYRVIKDQVYGGAQRIALVILQQLNAEADDDFAALASKYKHLDLENAQTQLVQSIHKSVKVQTNKSYVSVRYKPKEQQQSPFGGFQQKQQAPQQQQQQVQVQTKQQSNDNEELMQLRKQVDQLKKEQEEEKQKRIMLQQTNNEMTKQMMAIQNENNQLKQQMGDMKSKEKAGKSRDEKKAKEYQLEKAKFEREIADLKTENDLMKRQIENEKRRYENQITQMTEERKEMETALSDAKLREAQLRAEIEELKKRQVDMNEKEETKEFSIPLSYFYNGSPYVFNHMGFQFSIPTLGQIEDEKRYVYNDYGTPINGKKRDLIVVSRIKDDDDFEREGANLIKKVYFGRDTRGREAYLEIVLPNQVIQPFNILVEEGMFEVEGFGLMKKDGSRGSLVIQIELC